MRICRKKSVLTLKAPLAWVVLVLCSWCSAVLEYFAAVLVFSSYCCNFGIVRADRYKEYALRQACETCRKGTKIVDMMDNDWSRVAGGRVFRMDTGRCLIEVFTTSSLPEISGLLFLLLQCFGPVTLKV